MSRSVCHVATSEDAGTRLDAVLGSRGIYKSRSAAAKAIEAGCVLVNGKPANKKHIVCAGEALVCKLDEAAGSATLEGDPIDLDIRYEDEDMLVLSKQAGLLTHPTDKYLHDTLANALVYKYGVDGLCNVQGESDRPGIVHRLDGDTSGLMLAAKTNTAGEELMEQIRLRAVDRRYIALVHGIIAPETAMIDAPIQRHPTDRTKMSVRDGPSSRDAITTFKVLERFDGSENSNGYTLVECKLFTGRTHQIRVHMQYAKHPVVGDPIYSSNGPKDPAAQLGLKRQFLHSWHIGLDHPITGERIELNDGLPHELKTALQRLENTDSNITEEGETILKALKCAPEPKCRAIDYD